MAFAQQISTSDSKQILFPGKKTSISLVEDEKPKSTTEHTWKILVVDDDSIVHQVTSMVMDDISFKGYRLEILHAYSGAEAQQILTEQHDIAVILLDVVMETDSAGLDTVRFIRDEIENHFVRIILRTGQPGQAPEREVITDYDINDYKEKTELTSQKLYTCIITALRAYHDLRNVEKLTNSNTELEKRVRERTQEIMLINKELQTQINERNKVLEQLLQNERRLQEAQHIAGIGNWEWNISSQELNISDELIKILDTKLNNTETLWKNMLELVVEEDKPQLVSAYEKLEKFGTPYDIEHRVVCTNGELKYIRQQGAATKKENDNIICLAGTLQDITQRRQTEEQMRKLSGAVEQIADAVMITNSSGLIEYINPAFEAMTGYSPHEVIGKTPRILKSGQHHLSFYENLWKTILSGRVFSDVIINQKKNGEYYYEEKTITPQKNRYGDIVHFISSGKDVSERIEAQERLHYLAHHDSLTGLPNRILLVDRLEQALARSRWHNRQIAVLFIDLDRFKVINDTLGHSVGDILLKIMAKRLKISTREGDTIARLGGDEFAVVLNDVANINDIIPIADKIVASMSEPAIIDEQELFITVSIGIAQFPRDGTNSHDLLKKADIAMYRAKSQGKDRYQIYDDKDEQISMTRLSMETRLRRALDREEFYLNYQPQINIKTGEVIGNEALLRWNNPDMQIVSPAQFIPILEETGMIAAIGDWVLHTACRQEKKWQQQGLPHHRISVNLSIRQLQRPGLVQRIESILAETGLEPCYLDLELTEGLLIEKINATAKILHELNEMGVRLSIDDFGTGYSSMNYLKRLPFNTLKIDRSFVRDITFNPDDAAIASAIISLGHTLGMQVIAEGVETFEQLRYLHNNGCDAFQGYFYSPPLTHDALELLIKQRKEKPQPLND